MKIDFNTLGKRLLSYSFAILFGVLIWQAILEAHAPSLKKDKSVQGPYEITFNEPDSLNTFKLIDRLKSLTSKDSQIFLLASDKAKTELDKIISDSKPFCYVTSGKTMYAIDDNGYVLFPADSLEYYNIPVLSGKKLSVDLSEKRLGAGVFPALEFYKILLAEDKVLASQLVEINMDDKAGLIANFYWNRTVPVIIGKGKLKYKSECINSLYKQYGYSDYFENVKSLDLRIDGRAILKKNS